MNSELNIRKLEDALTIFLEATNELAYERYTQGDMSLHQLTELYHWLQNLSTSAAGAINSLEGRVPDETDPRLTANGE